MNTSTLSKTFVRGSMGIWALSFGMLLGVWELPGALAQSRSDFSVSVNLIKQGSSNTVLCSSNIAPEAFSSTVIVVCSTYMLFGLEAIGRGKPLRSPSGESYRLFTYVTSDVPTITVDRYTVGSTSTTFRILSAAGQQYVEMTVGW